MMSSEVCTEILSVCSCACAFVCCDDNDYTHIAALMTGWGNRKRNIKHILVLLRFSIRLHVDILLSLAPKMVVLVQFLRFRRSVVVIISLFFVSSFVRLLVFSCDRK